MFCDFFKLFIFEEWCKCTFKKEWALKMREKIFLFESWRSLKKRAGSGAGSASGSVSQSNGYEDPDPYKNVTDPEHWFEDPDSEVIQSTDPD